MKIQDADTYQGLFGYDRPLAVLEPTLCDLSRIVFKAFFPEQHPYDTSGQKEYICEDSTALYRNPAAFCRWIEEREDEGQMVVICSRVGTRALEVLPMIDLTGMPTGEELRTMMLRLANRYRSAVHVFESGASYHIYMDRILSDEQQWRGQESVLADFQANAQLLLQIDGNQYMDKTWLPHQLLRNGMGGLRVSRKRGRYPRLVATVHPSVIQPYTDHQMWTLEERIEWVIQVLKPLGCRSLLLHGGALSPSFFSLGVSDIDLTIVVDDQTIAFDTLVRICECLEPYGYDLGILKNSELCADLIEVYQVASRSSRIMHPIEIYTLRESSQVLYGEDIRGALKSMPWREAVDRSLVHRFNSIGAMRFTQQLDGERVGEIRRCVFALLRDISALRAGHGLAKRDAIERFLERAASSEIEAKAQKLVGDLLDISNNKVVQPGDLKVILECAIVILIGMYPGEDSAVARAGMIALQHLKDQEGA